MFIDSIGLGDTNQPNSQIISKLKNLYYTLNSGINYLIFVIRKGRFSD